MSATIRVDRERRQHLENAASQTNLGRLRTRVVHCETDINVCATTLLYDTGVKTKETECDKPSQLFGRLDHTTAFRTWTKEDRHQTRSRVVMPKNPDQSDWDVSRGMAKPSARASSSHVQDVGRFRPLLPVILESEFLHLRPPPPNPRRHRLRSSSLPHMNLSPSSDNQCLTKLVT